MSSSEADHRNSMQEVFSRVGRNVVFVQQLEQTLKLLLPLIASLSPGRGLNALNDEHSKISRNTLGQLMGSFRESFSIENREYDQMLKNIVKERNELVHHFHEHFGHLLVTPKGRAAVAAKLDEQYEGAKQLEDGAKKVLSAILRGLAEITFRDTDEYEQMSALCKTLESSLSPSGAKIELEFLGWEDQDH